MKTRLLSLLFLALLPACADLRIVHDLNDMFFQDETEDPDRSPAAENFAPDADAEAAHAEAEEALHQEVREALKHQDIVVGMEMDDVLRAWGEPGSVEYAGDRSAGNQKWTYYSGLSSAWSLRSGKIVYFEDGRVVGWDRR